VRPRLVRCGVSIRTVFATDERLELAELRAGELSAIAWSLASRQSRNVPLLDAIAHAVIPKVQAGNYAPGILAITAWAFARLEMQHSTLVGGIACAVRASAFNFSTRDLSNILWANARLLYVDASL